MLSFKTSSQEFSAQVNTAFVTHLHNPGSRSQNRIGNAHRNNRTCKRCPTHVALRCAPWLYFAVVCVYLCCCGPETLHGRSLFAHLVLSCSLKWMIWAGDLPVGREGAFSRRVILKSLICKARDLLPDGAAAAVSLWTAPDHTGSRHQPLPWCTNTG